MEPTTPTPERYLNLHQVCAITGLLPKTIRRISTATGGLSVCRVSSRCLRWPASAVHAWMRAHTERA